MKKHLRPLRDFFVFFCIAAFLITCCLTLFLTVLTRTMGLVLTSENLQTAAKLTFANVVLLSLLCTAVDLLRRRWTVERPAKRITEAAEKLMQGDFDVRIPTSVATDENFAAVIACFNRMAQELASIETLRTDFVSNVSHELKTPLSIIQNYASMLGQPALPQEQRQEYTAAIFEAASRLSQLVGNILKLNRLENARIFPEAQVYDLSDQLAQCLLEHEELLEKKRLDVRAELDEGVLVKADAEMMALVWNNLLSNAIKFTDEGGQITLRLTVDGSDAVIEVTDNGCGIAPEVGRHIFDKFYQGDSSRASQGNGLGLALVKRVIDLSGSDITVHSEVGTGSTFTVRMRRMENDA